MKNNNGMRRKFRYGSASLGLIALVIAGVILLNLAATLIFGGNLWFVDLTENPARYTLTEEGKSLLGDTLASANEGRAENDPVAVDIIFCADPDMLYGNETMRYVYLTALQMEKEYSDTIRVKTVDVWDNPSAVDDYRTNAYSAIYQSNVIVASGTEFRVYNPRSFYTYNEGESTPWAYNIEKTFIKGILAVTRAEAPICAITVGHGEPFDPVTGETEYKELLNVIKKAGYDYTFVDLTKDELPEHCRLVVTFDPQTDFTSDFLSGGVSEITKLEKHLNKSYSYLIFVDADTPKLTNLEEFLEEWGISFARKDKSATYEIVDVNNALNSEGTVMVGQYAQDGFGSTLTTDMRQYGEAPKVVFENALAINYSPTYQQQYQLPNVETGAGAYVQGYYYSNDWSRTMFDVFTASDTAYAYAKENGTRVTDSEGNLWKDTKGNYRLMTLTRQLRIQSEGKGYTNVYPNTYVCAVGSTAFASDETLTSNAYGNTDLLLSALYTIGREIVAVGFDPTVMHDEEMGIEYHSEQRDRIVAAILIALPAAHALGAGFVVLVRRRRRR